MRSSFRHLRFTSATTLSLFIIMILAPSLLCPLCSVLRCHKAIACEVAKVEEETACSAKSCCSKACGDQVVVEVDYVADLGTTCDVTYVKPCDIKAGCCCPEIPQTSEFTIEKRSVDAPKDYALTYSRIPAASNVPVEIGDASFLNLHTVHLHIPTTVLRL